MEKLPLETQTLYAQLMETLLAMETQRSIGRLEGCLTTKTIKGLTYCYFQYSDPGGLLRQVYLGRKDAALDRVIKTFMSEREASKPDKEHLQRLCAQLRAGGALVTDMASSRVLKALADSGVFQLGCGVGRNPCFHRSGKPSWREMDRLHSENTGSGYRG